MLCIINIPYNSAKINKKKERNTRREYLKESSAL